MMKIGYADGYLGCFPGDGLGKVMMKMTIVRWRGYVLWLPINNCKILKMHLRNSFFIII
jgi:hypothetical protein